METGSVPLKGEYEPSTMKLVGDQVESADFPGVWLASRPGRYPGWSGLLQLWLHTQLNAAAGGCVQ